jgi:hypothetical protein
LICDLRKGFPITGQNQDTTSSPGRLTPGGDFEQLSPYLTAFMGQQFNKHIKKKRRVAYLKRKKARIKAAIGKK